MRQGGRSRCDGLGGRDECGQVVVCMDAVRACDARTGREGFAGHGGLGSEHVQA